MRFLIFIFFFSFSSASLAASAAPTFVSSFYASAANDTHYADISFRTSSTTYGTKYLTKKVAVSAATMGRLARLAMRGPAGLAITAAMAAYDYVYDSAGDSFSNPGIPASESIDCPSGIVCDAGYWPGVADYTSDDVFPDFQSAVQAGLNKIPGAVIHHIDVSGSNAVVYVDYDNDGQVNLSFLVSPSSGPTTHDEVYVGGGSVSDADLGQKVFDIVDGAAYPSSDPDFDSAKAPAPVYSSPASNIGKIILNDALSRGVSDADFPELATARDALSSELAVADDPNQTNPFTPEQVQSMKTVDELKLDIPNDYNRELTQQSIAEDVSAIRDKMTGEPPEVPPSLGSEIPLLDWEVINLPNLSTDEITSPAGASCPVPVHVTVLGGDIAFDYQPLCDLAIKLNPFFVGLGWLSAALVVITGGTRLSM